MKDRLDMAVFFFFFFFFFISLPPPLLHPWYSSTPSLSSDYTRWLILIPYGALMNNCES
jgi:hypothetical protein